MRRRRCLALVLVVAGGCVAAPAVAQHRHDHKPKHGGLVREANDFVYELTVTPTAITVWVTDESDRPVATAGSSATLVLIDSGQRVEVVLAPAGDNRFAASGAWKFRAGTGALLEVGVGGRTVAKLRYTLR
ncbi:MAG: hypothetical protein U1F51_16940 [Burkholderiales bacterium]